MKSVLSTRSELAAEELQSYPGHPFSDAERERRGQLTLVACSAEEDKTRQEFAAQVDVNRVVNQFGQQFHQMTAVSGFDQELDLQGALTAFDQAVRKMRSLPKAALAKWPTIEQLLAASASGELEHFLKPAVPPAAVAGGSAGSPSDSAAVGGRMPDKAS